MILIINGNEIQSRKDFFDAVAHTIELPEYFGNNLDALYDVLSEKGYEDITLRISGIKNFSAKVEAHYCQRLIDLFIDLGATVILKD